MNTTKIEWTERSWNPITGCSPVSDGCRNCYARRMAKRLRGRAGYPSNDPFRVTFHPDRLEEPLRMRKPRKIFVCSMGDLFHPGVPDEWIDQVFAIMALCPNHTFQVLTKRAERMAKYFGEAESGKRKLADAACYGMSLGFFGAAAVASAVKNWPLPNVWAGVSAENQATADERIPHLLNTPAAVRFVSVEPMLGPVDITRWIWQNSLDGSPAPKADPVLHWVIVGGETGPGARPMHPDWVRSLRDQCKVAGVPFFFKQWGDWATRGRAYIHTFRDVPSGYGDHHRMFHVGKKAAGNVLDGQRWEEK